jgi:hypothetical protein
MWFYILLGYGTETGWACMRCVAVFDAVARVVSACGECIWRVHVVTGRAGNGTSPFLCWIHIEEVVLGQPLFLEDVRRCMGKLFDRALGLAEAVSIAFNIQSAEFMQVVGRRGAATRSGALMLYIDVCETPFS